VVTYDRTGPAKMPGKDQVSVKQAGCAASGACDLMEPEEMERVRCGIAWVEPADMLFEMIEERSARGPDIFG